MLDIKHFCALARVAITIKFLTPGFRTSTTYSTYVNATPNKIGVAPAS